MIYDQIRAIKNYGLFQLTKRVDPPDFANNEAMNGEIMNDFFGLRPIPVIRDNSKIILSEDEYKIEQVNEFFLSDFGGNNNET